MDFFRQWLQNPFGTSVLKQPYSVLFLEADINFYKTLETTSRFFTCFDKTRHLGVSNRQK